MDKRYIAFAGSLYYPCGGMDDEVLRTNDLKAALKEIDGFDWGHVFDMQTGDIIQKPD